MTSSFSLSQQHDSLPETKPPFAEDSTTPLEQDVAIDSDGSSFACPQGRYYFRNEIGRGGMGVVINAYDTLLRRSVAIKLLLRKFLNKPEIQRQFIDEALLTCCLQHPSIPPIYDRGYSIDQRPFFVMKLISGVSLAKKLAESSIRQLDRLSLLNCFKRICQTISYAHSEGILHLDIKPGNVMIGEFGEVHLMDWGQSKIWKPVHPITPSCESEEQTGSGKSDGFPVPKGTGGTLAYMSPEQARGDKVCQASDIFSLGALLCEILIGRPPYRASNIRRLLKSAQQGNTMEALLDLDSSKCDDQLVNLAKRCLASNPSERPADAGIVAKEIGNYLETALELAEGDRCRFFDLTLDMFCIATLEGYFVRLNKNFTRVLGYSESKLVSEPFMNFVHPDDRMGTQEVMKRLLEGKPAIQFCNRYRHERGHYLVFEWTAQSLPEEGNIFAVARDVTNRRIRDFDGKS